MKSKSSTTHELDDMSLAAEELAAVLEGFAVEKNTIGLLLCDPKVDIKILTYELKQRLPFDFIGCVTHAMLDNMAGISEFAISLTVLTGDDCEFDVFISDEFDTDNVKPVIGKLCEKANSTKARDAKMVFFYTTFVPGIMLDHYVEGFSKGIGNKPLFGGVAAMETSENFSVTIYNTEIYSNRIVVLYIGGSLRPVFSVGQNTSCNLKKRQVVTSSKDNIIYKVGNKTFLEYLHSIRLVIDLPKRYEMDLLLASITLNVETNDSNEVEMYRSIFSLNREDGSGVALAGVPEGSKICAVAQKSEDIVKSAKNCVEDLLAKMKKVESEHEDYKYSTILCGSCNVRYMFMLPTKENEGSVLVENIPSEINTSGFYTYGEFCPVSRRDGDTVNCCHNAVISMCAL